MKFWATLVIGTISITAGMTYLVMHQGAQTLADPTASPPKPPTKVSFPKGQLEGHVLALEGGVSHVGKESVLVVPFRCAGEQMLHVELIRLSCACAHGLQFNGKKMDTGDSGTVAPGATGDLRFTWTPKPEQSGNPSFRITATFLLNDPQFADVFRIEISTTVRPSEEK